MEEEFDIEMRVSTRPLPKGKYGRLIPEHREKEYLEVVAAAVGHGHKVEFAWPWLQSIPENHPCVMDANRKALDMARKSLIDYLRTHKPKTIGQKFVDFVRNELRYMKKMWGVNAAE